LDFVKALVLDLLSHNHRDFSTLEPPGCQSENENGL